VPIFSSAMLNFFAKLPMTLWKLPGKSHVDNPSVNGEKLVQKEKVA
jgi:hypothetical protein